MSLQSSWHDSFDEEARRHRQVIRQSQAKKKVGKLALVPPVKLEIPAIVPSDYIRDHGEIEPPRRPIEFALLGIAAIGIHLAAAWFLAHLPPGQLLAPPKPEPVEISFAAPPPPPPPPPKVEPPKPKVVEKIVKSPVPVVPFDVPNTVADTTNVVMAEKGPPPAPIVEKVTAARADASYLNNPVPEYPPVALRQGLQGTVQLRVLVQPDGRPSTITLEKSSGKKVLDDAALAAVRNWKFVPAKRGEEAIEGWVSFPIEFNLES